MNKSNSTAWIVVILIVMGFVALVVAAVVAVGALFFVGLKATSGPAPMPSIPKTTIVAPDVVESPDEIPELDIEESLVPE